MILKTKRNMGIINAIIMLVVNVVYMIVVAVKGMSFFSFSGFEVPIDSNLMVLLFLFSLIINMLVYAFLKRELTKKNKIILTLALLVNTILGMSGVIAVLSIMTLFLINSNYDCDKEVELNSLIKYIIVGFIIGAGISYFISMISTNLFIVLCEGMLIGLGASINIKFIKLK